MNTYYYICPYCGAFLDPGERCDCEKRQAARQDQEVREQDPEKERSGDNGERAQLSVNQ